MEVELRRRRDLLACSPIKHRTHSSWAMHHRLHLGGHPPRVCLKKKPTGFSSLISRTTKASSPRCPSLSIGCSWIYHPHIRCLNVTLGFTTQILLQPSWNSRCISLIVKLKLVSDELTRFPLLVVSPKSGSLFISTFLPPRRPANRTAARQGLSHEGGKSNVKPRSTRPRTNLLPLVSSPHSESTLKMAGLTTPGY